MQADIDPRREGNNSRGLRASYILNSLQSRPLLTLGTDRADTPRPQSLLQSGADGDA